MKYILIILAFLLSTNVLFTQKSGQELTDSLLFELPKAKQDSNKFILLLKLSANYKLKDSIKKINTCLKAMKLAKQIDYYCPVHWE